MTAFQYDAELPGWGSVGSTFTNPDGTYDLALAAGSYRVGFDDYTGDAVPEYYQDTTVFDEADSVLVDAAPVQVDADLAEAAHVRGAVVGGDLTESYVYVTAYQAVVADGQTSYDYVGSTNAGTDGEYDLGGLPAGTYRIGFESTDLSLAPEYYNNKGSLAAAQDVVTSAASPAIGIDATLEEAGSISGTMTTEEGDPATGRVTAYTVAGDDWTYITSEEPDSEGAYTLAGLREGSYLVAFEEDATGRTEYWQDTDDADLATPVEVEAGTPSTGISAEMDDKTPPDAVQNLEYPSISGNTEVGSTLTADPGQWDATGVTFTYQWISGNHDDGAIPGATGSTYVLNSSDADDYIGVIVTAHADGYSPASEYSDYVGPVQAQTVHSLSVPTISGTPQVGSPLTANPGTWDQPGATFSYYWETYQEGQEHTDFLATGKTYVPTAAIVGQPVWVSVVASAPGVEDGYAYSESVGPVTAATAPPVVVPPVVVPPVVAPPVTDVDNTQKPKVQGAKKVGSTLKAKVASWIPAGATVRYQWLVNGKPIKKATKATLKVTRKLKGKKVSVQVIATSAGSKPATVVTKVGKIK